MKKPLKILLIIWLSIMGCGLTVQVITGIRLVKYDVQCQKEEIKNKIADHKIQIKSIKDSSNKIIYGN